MKKFTVYITALQLLCLSTSAFGSQPQLPFMKSTDFTPFWPGTEKIDPLPATVSNFEFKNQGDKVLTDGNMKGHISLVNFFFTSCGMVCPRLMSKVQSVQKELASIAGLRIYSFSVMPEVDSPARLLTYAHNRKIDLKNWDLVTGDRAAI
jgi:protein SCO1/2